MSARKNKHIVRMRELADATHGELMAAHRELTQIRDEQTRINRLEQSIVGRYNAYQSAYRSLLNQVLHMEKLEQATSEEAQEAQEAQEGEG